MDIKMLRKDRAVMFLSAMVNSARWTWAEINGPWSTGAWCYLRRYDAGLAPHKVSGWIEP